jgi:hypothetical protein
VEKVFYVVIADGREPFLQQQTPFPQDVNRSRPHYFTIGDVGYWGPFRSTDKAQEALEQLDQ